MTLKHSYGIIPVFFAEGEPEYLLINQIDGRKGTAYWTFPKGTPEEGETPIETARRETIEEVGITFSDVDETVTFDSEYTFEIDGVPIPKIATYYLGVIETKEVQLQEAEVSEVKWLPYAAAREQLTYERSKELLDQIHEHVTARLSPRKSL